ncbi:MAG: 3-dehydroquinate synthase [Sutterellaceae bacterium]|nr:3-dehydroquinate synthase [Sutterellaceae bacterium]
MIDLTVELGERSYPIYIAEGALDKLGSEVKRLRATRVLVVSNTTVAPLYAEKALQSIRSACPDLSVGLVELPDGECYKDLAHIEKILDGAVETGLDRKSLMVALGGGVVGDMCGFAASLWMRGIDFIQVPTTLLSQVDSSVGGKTGVNLAAGKNLIGAFHQPRSVLIDTDVLKTLPAREISAGIAEIIKYGFLGDADFVARLERDMPKLRALDAQTVGEIVAHCCRMKAAVVREDEKENGVRAKLNLGHTFGHAIEKETGFDTWLHGEAVGAGTVMAALLSQKLGYLTDDEVCRIRNLVEASGLPTHIDGIDAQAAYRAMLGDKKSVGGQIRFIVMTAVGQCHIEKVPEDVVWATMKQVGWH